MVGHLLSALAEGFPVEVAWVLRVWSLALSRVIAFWAWFPLARAGRSCIDWAAGHAGSVRVLAWAMRVLGVAVLIWVVDSGRSHAWLAGACVALGVYDAEALWWWHAWVVAFAAAYVWLMTGWPWAWFVRALAAFVFLALWTGIMFALVWAIGWWGFDVPLHHLPSLGWLRGHWMRGGSVQWSAGAAIVACAMLWLVGVLWASMRAPRVMPFTLALVRVPLVLVWQLAPAAAVLGGASLLVMSGPIGAFESLSAWWPQLLARALSVVGVEVDALFVDTLPTWAYALTGVFVWLVGWEFLGLAAALGYRVLHVPHRWLATRRLGVDPITGAVDPRGGWEPRLARASAVARERLERQARRADARAEVAKGEASSFRQRAAQTVETAGHYAPVPDVAAVGGVAASPGAGASGAGDGVPVVGDAAGPDPVFGDAPSAQPVAAGADPVGGAGAAGAAAVPGTDSGVPSGRLGAILGAAKRRDGGDGAQAGPGPAGDVGESIARGLIDGSGPRDDDLARQQARARAQRGADDEAQREREHRGEVLAEYEAVRRVPGLADWAARGGQGEPPGVASQAPFDPAVGDDLPPQGPIGDIADLAALPELAGPDSESGIRADASRVERGPAVSGAANRTFGPAAHTPVSGISASGSAGSAPGGPDGGGVRPGAVDSATLHRDGSARVPAGAGAGAGVADVGVADVGVADVVHAGVVADVDELTDDVEPAFDPVHTPVRRPPDGGVSGRGVIPSWDSMPEELVLLNDACTNYRFWLAGSGDADSIVRLLGDLVDWASQWDFSDLPHQSQAVCSRYSGIFDLERRGLFFRRASEREDIVRFFFAYADRCHVATVHKMLRSCDLLDASPIQEDRHLATSMRALVADLPAASRPVPELDPALPDPDL